MMALIILFCHWAWTLAGHLPDGLGHLFPRNSKERMKKVLESLQLHLPFKIREFPKNQEIPTNICMSASFMISFNT